MGGSRTRRTGAVTLLLLTLAAAATAAVAWRLQSDSAAYWGSAIGGTFGLAGLYLAWASYSDDRAAETPALTLPEIADQLAVAVRAQWAAEVELRRLNDPYALPVRWEAAPAELVEDWATLERLATSGGVGWPPPPPAGTWGNGPEDLAGSAGDLVDVLGRIPTGRLVLLGEPGTGKTILLARLAVDLLADGRRGPGEPVPVLLPLASWDPTRQHFYDWFESRLAVDYPGLAEPALGTARRSRARALLDAGLVLPLLDGLDEIPAAVRGTAIARIGETLRPGQRLVLTVRSDPYRDAVLAVGGIEVRLTGAAGVELRLLEPGDVADYLRASAGGPTAQRRWDSVLATLSADPAPPVARALATPLMLGLARTIYNPRPGEPAATVPRPPMELLDPMLFPTRTAVEQHLFDAFVRAAYRPHPDPRRRSRWKPADAERWLVFLARHLERNLRGTPDLAWWQLSAAVCPRRAWMLRATVKLAFGLTGILAAGLTLIFSLELVRGLTFQLVGVLVGGLVAGLVADWRIATPTRAVRWRVRRGAVASLAGGLVGGLAGLVGGVAGGFSAGLVGGLVGALVFGLGSAPADLETAASPTSVLAQDRAAFRTIMLAFALAGGLAIAFVGGFLAGLAVGLAGGLVFGLAVGLNLTAWESFVLARGWMAVRHRLPHDLMAFLDDAHRRGVLRQAGAVYQFRHIELQRRLANR